MEETESYNIKKAIICFAILVVIIGIFYGITTLVVNNKNKKEESNENNSYTNIQYDEIIVSNILKQTASDYYVLATTKNDDNYKQYISDFTTYTTKKNALPSYRIDLDNSFNKKYLQDESNFDNELPVFSGSTLIRVTGGSITEIYESSEISSAISHLVNGI